MDIYAPHEFRHVRWLWDDARFASLAGVERLVYRSNLLGSDRRITNTGGGNTSSKLQELDPLTGTPVVVLWVKGSGGDLRTSTRANFASLYQERLLSLEPLYELQPARGVKSSAEDAMVALYPHCTFALNPRPASIDTPLHAFVAARHVDHMHPDAVIAIAASKRSRQLTQEIWGGEIGWLPWMRPGFELGLALRKLQRENPQLKGVLLAQHGVISWDDDDKVCYARSLSIAERAARFIEERAQDGAPFEGRRFDELPQSRRHAVLADLLPWLRGRIGDQRMIATVHDDAAMLAFSDSKECARLAALGTSCPDHFLRTKIFPLFVGWDPEAEGQKELRAKLETGLAEYRARYAEYYARCKRPDSPPLRDPNPTVVVIPGLGMIAFGKTKSESRVTAEFYVAAVEVMRGAETVDSYVALPEQEAFDIEYWALEEAKLRRMPPEAEFSRRVVLVVGAGSGIGKAAALRMAREGAHVVCADLDLPAARATASEIEIGSGKGIGVAGTGDSACGPAFATEVDVTKRESVRALLERVALAYGGLDHIVVTAGVYVAPDAKGTISDAMWRLTFDVNVLGAYLVVDEAKKLFAAQNLPGSIVITTSVNAVVAKKGSLAYDSSKAAANHLVRELAIELAPKVRVNAIAPATVVAGSTMFPKDRVIASLQKYSVPHDQNADVEVLRRLLADFYAQRTLTKRSVLPEDQAEAIWFLLSDRSSKSTGQVLAVDGGLADAFPR